LGRVATGWVIFGIRFDRNRIRMMKLLIASAPDKNGLALSAMLTSRSRVSMRASQSCVMGKAESTDRRGKTMATQSRRHGTQTQVHVTPPKATPVEFKATRLGRPRFGLKIPMERTPMGIGQKTTYA
jgi:hypothetical protein